jgi:hypothetical protein
MLGVSVEIRGYVDDAQPGWVECRLVDAHGREWQFIENVPVVTTELLDAGSLYPRPGVIACEEIDRRPGPPTEVVIIETEQPWGVEAVTGETRFEVRPDQLVEVAAPSW